jgi:hypothetical protein
VYLFSGSGSWHQRPHDWRVVWYPSSGRRRGLLRLCTRGSRVFGQDQSYSRVYSWYVFIQLFRSRERLAHSVADTFWDIPKDMSRSMRITKASLVTMEYSGMCRPLTATGWMQVCQTCWKLSKRVFPTSFTRARVFSLISSAVVRNFVPCMTCSEHLLYELSTLRSALCGFQSLNLPRVSLSPTASGHPQTWMDLRSK